MIQNNNINCNQIFNNYDSLRNNVSYLSIFRMFLIFLYLIFYCTTREYVRMRAREYARASR